ncbi:Sister chromatid cohesion protein SCC2 [Camellia lanceoleosa]|uniref:Sister chromatid cohesion protein SCC2 n=1 Tax=Camellia lanceoleosa TaxID=1840588 RepID=A0ACC0HEP2_9ERIC|nr:Sister chromatid cohesion protein SCC2 [Camellia lanceoleosa]
MHINSLLLVFKPIIEVIARLLESIIFVIDYVLAFASKLPQNVVEELEQDQVDDCSAFFLDSLSMPRSKSQMATDNNSNNVVNYSVDGGHSVPMLQIVEIVLRQGLVHPTTCVPYLIALETGPEEANSMLAHHLLMNMNEKYLAFCESRLGDGLQMSFIFIRSMVEVLKIQTQKSNSRYCTEILALFPFTLPDELLYLIYAMNRVIQVIAGTLEANMKAFLHSLQEDAKIVHVSVDSNLCSRSPCNSRGISEDDLQKIQLLLKLKRHLKIVYGLNDTRCQEFSPNEPLKLGEALPKQNIPFNTNETHIDLPINHQEVLQRYQIWMEPKCGLPDVLANVTLLTFMQ